MVLTGPEASRDPGSFGSLRADTPYTHNFVLPASVWRRLGWGVSLPMGTAGEGGGAGWHIQEASKHTLGSSGSTLIH